MHMMDFQVLRGSEDWEQWLWTRWKTSNSSFSLRSMMFSVLRALPFQTPSFLSPSFSFSKIKIGRVKSLTNHLSLRLFFSEVPALFSGMAGHFKTVESSVCLRERVCAHALNRSPGLGNAKQHIHVSFLVADSFPNYVLLRLILKWIGFLWQQ